MALSKLIGPAVYRAHRAIQAVGAWFDCGTSDPTIQRLQSRRAWHRFQNRVRAEREAARVKHAPVEPINERQQAAVIAALQSFVRQRETA